MKIHFIKTPDGRELYPALGFSYVMAEVNNAGYDVEFIDANLIDYPFDLFLINPRKCIKIKPNWTKIKEFFKPLNIEYALLTGSFTKYIGNTSKMASILKEANPCCVTIVGGVHVSALPEDTLLKFKDIDFVVIGEGEETAVDLISALVNKSDITKILSIAYRNNGKIIVNKGNCAISNLDTISYPIKSIWPIEEYRRVWKYLWNGKDPLGVVITSRGCIGKCIFCASSKKEIAYNALRFRSFENIKNELDELFNNYNIRSIDFIDDCFTVNRQRLTLICDYLKVKKIPWICKSRIDTLSKEMLKMMKNSGCQSIFLGIESTNNEILKTIGKGISFEQIKSCLKLFEIVGLEYTASFTIGHPRETRESMMETLNFAKKLARKGTGVGLYLITPYPGTYLYDLSRRNGWLNSDNWDHFDQLAERSSVYAYDGWTPEELTRFYHFAWKKLNKSRFFGKILNWKLILRRKLKMINSLNDIKILFNQFLSAIGRQIKQ